MSIKEERNYIECHMLLNATVSFPFWKKLWIALRIVMAVIISIAILILMLYIWISPIVIWVFCVWISEILQIHFLIIMGIDVIWGLILWGSFTYLFMTKENVCRVIVNLMPILMDPFLRLLLPDVIRIYKNLPQEQTEEK